MNYFEWSQEYTDTANELEKVVGRLKSERQHACESKKQELAEKIIMYRALRNECLKTAALLMDRHRGVA